MAEGMLAGSSSKAGRPSDGFIEVEVGCRGAHCYEMALKATLDGLRSPSGHLGEAVEGRHVEHHSPVETV